MIPREITREHILEAIEVIDRNGVPAGRQSRKFLLRHSDRLYPPKYVVSLACNTACRRPLGSDEFGGGAETNGFLASLGFEIVGRAGTVVMPARRSSTYRHGPDTESVALTAKRVPLRPGSERHGRPGAHKERCPVCKTRVEELLGTLYGKVQKGKSFAVPAHPDALAKRVDIPLLRRVYDRLVSLKGNRDFVRQDHLPSCDYFVPEPGFVLEFDESQHFTAARALSLEGYGQAVPVGFDVARWIDLCRKIDAHDSDPPYRDEQRAWYDTLRDCLPLLVGELRPTVRLLAGERRWCELSPGEEEDLALFRDWLALPCRFEVTPRFTGNTQPFWGRLIVRGPWYGGALQAQRLLNAVCDQWPSELKTRVLVASGGFVSFEWPSNVTRDDVGDNRYPNPQAVDALFSKADAAVASMLSADLRSRLLCHTDAISFGVDSFKAQVSTTNELIKDLHVELVYFVDLRTNTITRTGKTYPTGGQEAGLVRIADVASHFTIFDGDTVCLLGCHDLNAFSPRGNSRVKRRWRKDVIRDLKQAVRQKSPKIVVHHPHTTDWGRIWQSAWNRLVAVAGSVDLYASAGRYHNADGDVRDQIEGVLKATVLGGSLDLVTSIACGADTCASRKLRPGSAG
jgi:hypothetical protein